jgi:hypothetical protein
MWVQWFIRRKRGREGRRLSEQGGKKKIGT